MKTKLLKFTKLHLTKLLSIFFFILLFSSYLSTFAIGQPYNPGETLDPSCAPGDTNCTVTVGGTPSGSSGQIQFNNGGLFAGTADLAWTAGTATTHFSVGPGITFTKADYETVPNPAVDEISPSVHITRGQDRAIYNTVSESEYDNSTYLSPLGTEWNSADGWSDLSNISTRTYDTFYNALGGSIGDNIIGAELVMHDIAEDTYYKFSFSFWASNGTGGGFSYTRNLIDPLTFALGPSVTFTKTFPTDIVSTSVHLTRAGTKGLYNPLQEQFYDDNDYLSPLGTEWNSDGWNDLADVDTRTYDTFYNVLDQSVGNNIIGAELVMHDIAQNKYYKFSFSSWTQNGNGSGFSYTRNLITLGNGSENLLTTSSNLLIGGSARYLNFGTNSGNSGYGIRDTGGVLQFKHDGGAWANLGEGPINLMNGSSLFSGGAIASGISSTSYHSLFLGEFSGNNTTGANYSNFLGRRAGENADQARYSNFLGPSAGSSATNAYYSNFLGTNTGSSATDAYHSNFLGREAGMSATDAYYSNFLGYAAGSSATYANYSNFLGSGAGFMASSASESNFLGTNAGNLATGANDSNFIGNGAGQHATNAEYSNFIGYLTGQSASDANYSNFIGFQSGTNAFNAANSIFIGNSAGLNDPVDNTGGTTSILIGNNTNTGGNQNSIVLGPNATNTMTNQFLISPTYSNFRIRDVNYVMPASQATGAGQVLTNDGSGNLNWSSAGSPFSSDILVNGITVGRGSGNISNNTVVGYQAGLNVVAQYNTFVGYQAGLFGSGSTSSDADSNTGIGYRSLYFNSTGGSNTASGFSSLYSNTTGGRNVANGYDSMFWNIVGYDNVANGHMSLYSNTTGSQNTANGSSSLYRNTDGVGNTANGYQALYSNTTGNINTANGSSSLYSNTTGGSNTANGFHSLYSNTTGSDNVANGSSSLGSNTTGNNNTGNGSYSLSTNVSGSGNVALGSFAGRYETGSNAFYVDNQNRTDTTGDKTKALLYGTFNAAPSSQTLRINASLGVMGTPSELLTLGTAGTTAGIMSMAGATSGKIIIQPASSTSTYTLTLPSAQGGANTYLKNDGSGGLTWASAGGGSGPTIGSTSAIGTETWLGTTVANMGTASTYETVFLGVNAGYNASSAGDSVFIGAGAGYSATSSNGSNFIGLNTGVSASNAYSSNFIGNGAGYQATSAHDSNFMGRSAGQSATNAIESNFFGDNAGNAASAASYSNFLGLQTGYNATNAHDSNFLGSIAGFGASNASYSNLFGYQAGMTFTLNNIGANNIIIGTNISLPNARANAINLGGVLFGTGTYSNTSTDPLITPSSGGKIGIGVVTPAYTLDVSTGGVAGVVAQFTNSTGYCRIDPTSTALTCSSDISLKKNITNLGDNSPFTLTSNLDMTGKSITERLTSLIPVTYNWNTELDTDTKHAGFIAQQVQQVFPELVSADPSTNLLSLNTIGMIPYMINTIQAMDLRVKGIETISDDSTFTSSLKNWFASAGNGIGEFFANKVHTKELCVGDACVTEAQFLEMINKNTTPVVSSPIIPTPAPEVTPAPTPDPTEPEPTPVTPTEPTVTPTPEPTPTPEVITPEIPAEISTEIEPSPSQGEGTGEVL